MAPAPKLGPVSVTSAALQAHRASLLRLGGGIGGSNKQNAASLAQRLGLVPGPPPPLTPARWLEVRLQRKWLVTSCVHDQV